MTDQDAYRATKPLDLRPKTPSPREFTTISTAAEVALGLWTPEDMSIWQALIDLGARPVLGGP